MKTESRFFYWSVMVGHDVVLKATSGPRRKKGWEPLAYAQRTEPAGFASVFGNGNGNGLLFHMTQPISRSTIKAIACSKPTISEH